MTNVTSDMRDDNRTLERAYRLKEKGDYLGAFDLFERLADEENEYAHWQMADLFEKGLGAEKNLSKARSHLELAASISAGPAIAHALGRFYERVGEDSKAFSTIKRASDQECLPSIFRLGRYYEAGIGVGPDLEMARRLIDRAAKRGHLFARRYQAGRQIAGQEGLLRVVVGVWTVLKVVAAAPVLVSRDPRDPRIVN
jgi:TPR repeat protein